MRKAVSFTGHRPEALCGYAPCQMHDEVKAFLRSAIERLSAEGYEEFISGAALGVDQWAAEIVLEKGLRLILALPFAKYGENWPAESQQYLAGLKAKAFEVVVVCEGEYFENGKAQKWKNHARNKWMEENSEVVVAVFDGRKDGGTASAIKNLKTKTKRVIRYNPISKKEEPI